MHTLIAFALAIFSSVMPVKRAISPISIAGGQYGAGNASFSPDGTLRQLNNYLTRPGRLPARPPFTYDNLMSIDGLCNFDDQTNRVTRLLAINTSHQVFEKGTSGETWGAANANTISGTRLTSSANYRGTTYMMFDDGTGLPSSAASFDGTNVSTSPFDSIIQSREIVTFDERLYFIYPRQVVTNYLGGTAPRNTDSYNMVTNWTLNSCTGINITNGSEITGRITTSSLAASTVSMSSNTEVAILPQSTKPQTVIFTMFIRSVNAHGADTPLSVDLRAANNVSRLTTYALGYYIVTGGNLHECTTAGTSAAGAPAFNATVTGTTVDGTVTWTNRGSSIIGQADNITLPDDGKWMRIDVAATIPGTVGSAIGIDPLVKFYSTLTPSLPVLASYDISFRDGLADGDPRKANFGWMVTIGDFFYPFHNSESASVNTATVDMEEVVWSEIGLPKTIRASNTYKLREAQGRPQAGTAIGGRLMVAKRNAIWQFQDTGDPDIPIRREKFMAGIGVIGPRAHDKFEDEWFTICESDVYRYKVGDDIPKPFAGEGMRETIFAKGANWVENQSVYKRPLLAIDQTQLIVWVYTQKGKLFAYDLRSGRWSTHYVSNGAEVDAMIWNPNTGNFYVSFGGFGLTRMDYTSNTNDTIDNTATTFAGDMSFVLPPVRYATIGQTYQIRNLRNDDYVEWIKLLYATSIDQIGQTLTASVSIDQGSTYPNAISYTPSLVSTSGDFVPIVLDICESGPSVTLKVARSGKLGEGSWAVSEEMEMQLKINRSEYPQSRPAAGSSTL